ncbi:hypothetical protein HDR61_02470 [bacterium]|nr:hypothetical protein [bacterium]
MKRICVICFVLCATAARSSELRIGDNVYQLDTQKRTTPALGFYNGEKTVYGALYTGAPPGKTLHVYNGNKYWMGQNCVAGAYSSDGLEICRPCTIGHYCPGGRDKITCTNGAFSCREKNLNVEGVSPNGAPLNKFMNIDEVNEFMPATDFSEWKEISCCGNKVDDGTGGSANISRACAHGTIGPGTYLFVARYSLTTLTEPDSISGINGTNANAFIAVFDHPVGYASIHWNNVLQHFVDTEHAQYEAYTMSTTPLYAWQVNKNETNVSNLTEWGITENSAWMCVFELE